MAQLTIRHGDVELATEAFGDPSDPALVLIMGAMASMLWWPEEFCERMAASGPACVKTLGDDSFAACFGGEIDGRICRWGRSQPDHLVPGIA